MLLVVAFREGCADTVRSVAQLSKSRVRKAGSIIRKYARGECGEDEYKAAIQTINQYRSEFTNGLNSLSNSLRSFTTTLNTNG